jgi:hypothetical protein
MIISAMYIYGMSQGSWRFNLLHMTICFIADMLLVRLNSIVNKTSDEERFYWRKRTEVEELRRVELDRQLYGKR